MEYLIYRGKVKEINGFTDTSHNSEIVKISNKTFADVLENLYRVEECYQDFLNKGEDVENLKKFDFSTVKKFIDDIAQGIANINNIIGVLKFLCP